MAFASLSIEGSFDWMILSILAIKVSRKVESSGHEVLSLSSHFMWKLAQGAERRNALRIFLREFFSEVADRANLRRAGVLKKR